MAEKKTIHGLTHSELVSIAARWLRGTAKCSVVLSELHSQIEVPDAIGWRGGRSILVECKATRDDFRCDLQKWFRRQDMPVECGMGVHRYYMTPSGLLTAADLPSGWGLLEVTFTGRVKKSIKSATWVLPIEWVHRELGLVLSALRREQE